MRMIPPASQRRLGPPVNLAFREVFLQRPDHLFRHTVLFGRADNLEQKIRQLHIVYDEALINMPADTYANHYSVCYGGDAGLRYSKLQYKPSELIEKYLVSIK